MNQVQFFNFEENPVRTIVIDGEPYFVGKDVADILGYKNGSRDVNVHVDEEDKLRYRISTSGQSRAQIIINESGLYSLIIGSKLPSAKKFKRWVTSEVLPTIRKHGAYLTDEKAHDITHNPDSLADLLMQAGEQLKKKDLIIKEMTPKAIFTDAVNASKTSVLIGDLAKILKQNGIDIGAQRLFSWLRNNGFLIKRKGTEWNMPTQKSMELELFEIKETPTPHADGHITINKTPKVTGKGQIYFVNKFLKNKQPV